MEQRTVDYEGQSGRGKHPFSMEEVNDLTAVVLCFVPSGVGCLPSN
jgi:hypothetical protein